MRFLVDAQLPPALARRITTAGHVSEHVADCGLLFAPDRFIRAHAARVGATIITKDEDFAVHLVLHGGPPIVWLRLGNTRAHARGRQGTRYRAGQRDQEATRLPNVTVLRAHHMTTTLTFPVVLDKDDNGTVLVTLPDFPGATFGDDADDALVRAQDLLITALQGYMSRRQPIPAPSAGPVRVGLPPSVALKVTVYQEMLKRGLTKAALAARMHQPKQQLDRFFKLRYRSRADQIDAAWNALGLTVRGVELGSADGGVPRASVARPPRVARKAARPRAGARKR